jgi:serine/threonine protein kinase
LSFILNLESSDSKLALDIRIQDLNFPNYYNADKETLEILRSCCNSYGYVLDGGRISRKWTFNVLTTKESFITEIEKYMGIFLHDVFEIFPIRWKMIYQPSQSNRKSQETNAAMPAPPNNVDIKVKDNFSTSSSSNPPNLSENNEAFSPPSTTSVPPLESSSVLSGRSTSGSVHGNCKLRPAQLRVTSKVDEATFLGSYEDSSVKIYKVNLDDMDTDARNRILDYLSYLVHCSQDGIEGVKTVEIKGWLNAGIETTTNAEGRSVFSLIFPPAANTYAASPTATHKTVSSILIACHINSEDSLYSWWKKIHEHVVQVHEYQAVYVVSNLLTCLAHLAQLSTPLYFSYLSPMDIYVSRDHQFVIIDLMPLFLEDIVSMSIERPQVNIESMDFKSICRPLFTVPGAVVQELSSKEAREVYSFGILLIMLFFTDSIEALKAAPVFQPLLDSTWSATTESKVQIQKELSIFCQDPPIYLSSEVTNYLLDIIDFCMNCDPLHPPFEDIEQLFSQLKDRLTKMPRQYNPSEFDQKGLNRVVSIGKGGSSRVFKAFCTAKDDWVALKQVHSDSNDSLQSFQYEIRLLSNLSHPNILKLYGVLGAHVRVCETVQSSTVSSISSRSISQPVAPATVSSPSPAADNEEVENAGVYTLLHVDSAELKNGSSQHRPVSSNSRLVGDSLLSTYSIICGTPKQIIMVTEYCPEGDLLNFLYHHRKVAIEGDSWGLFVSETVPILFKLLHDVASAMDHLHSRQILHRDLKPGNIFLRKDENGKFVAKVGDFGISKRLISQAKEGSSFVVVPNGGSLLYIAPESFDTGRYTRRADVYSFGMMLHDCFISPKLVHKFDFPFMKMREYTDEVFPRIFKHRYNNLQRVPFDTIEESPWASIPSSQQNFLRSLIDGCFKKDPKERPLFPEITQRLATFIAK